VAQGHHRSPAHATPTRSLPTRGAGAASLPVHEVVIIADIVLMITVDRTFDSAITLGIIVLVRTFLSFSLEIELEGSLPWRRGSTEQPPDPAVSVGDGQH
jgi:Protein of unknown function (DUF1622)